jgi:hypothetical protein
MKLGVLNFVFEGRFAVEAGLSWSTRVRLAVPYGDDMLKSAFEGRLV